MQAIGHIPPAACAHHVAGRVTPPLFAAPPAAVVLEMGPCHLPGLQQEMDDAGCGIPWAPGGLVKQKRQSTGGERAIGNVDGQHTDRPDSPPHLKHVQEPAPLPHAAVGFHWSVLQQ